MQDDTSEEDRSDEELGEKTVDMEKTFWFPKDNAYAHSSGMKLRPRITQLG